MSRINHVWLATYEFDYLHGATVESTVALTRSRNAELLIEPLSENPELLTGNDALLARQVTLLRLEKVPMGRGDIESVVRHLDGLSSERDDDDDEVAAESGMETTDRLENSRPIVGVDLAGNEPVYFNCDPITDAPAGTLDPFRYLGVESVRNSAPSVNVVQSVDAVIDALKDLRSYLSDQDS